MIIYEIINKMNNIYNDTEYADNLIGKHVHAHTGCLKMDIIGVVEKYGIFREEILYTIKSDIGATMLLGANTPNLNIEIIQDPKCSDEEN